MKLFNRKKETALAPIEAAPVVVSVPDIKDYLVKEYERVNALKMQNERLEEQLESSREIALKYDAAMVTLDEYSKRLEIAKADIEREKAKAERERQNADSLRDQLNSYKIKFNNAAMTKEQIKDEIIEEVQAEMISRIRKFKGRLSKERVCSLISDGFSADRKGEKNDSN